MRKREIETRLNRMEAESPAELSQFVVVDSTGKEVGRSEPFTPAAGTAPKPGGDSFTLELGEPETAYDELWGERNRD